MVIRNVELETVCGVTSTLPENTLPEFAFAGKSNVGKSSLINALMNRKALARTSSQPGKTQTINFYNINGALYYVDLPGYGYAKVPQSEKVKWGRMIENYLHKSQMLKCVFLLVDIRHEPRDRTESFRGMPSDGRQIRRHSYAPAGILAGVFCVIGNADRNGCSGCCAGL